MLERTTRPRAVGDGVDPDVYRDLVLTAFSLPYGARQQLLAIQSLDELVNESMSPGIFERRLEHLRGLRTDLQCVVDEVLETLPHAWGLTPEAATLQPAEHASILRRAIPGLLRPLGGGSSPQIAAALLTRIAASVASGGPPELRGTLMELFGSDLDDLQAKRTTEGKRDRVLTTIVRPMLTTLRTVPPVRVVVDYRVYIVQIELDSPERSHGPVRMPYAFRLRVIPVLDSDATSGMLTDIVLRPIRDALDRDLPLRDALLSRLGTIGARIAADASVAASRGSASVGPSSTRKALRVIDAISTVLTPSERWQLLANLFELRVDSRCRSVQFEDSFLWAADVRLPDSGDDLFDTRVVKARLQLLQVPFVEKVALLAWYGTPTTPWALRYRFWNALSFLRRAVLFDAPIPPFFAESEPSLDVLELVQARVGDVDGFLKLAEEQDFGQLLGGRWIPWTD